MFHKPKKIYVNKSAVLPIKRVLMVITFYFLLDVYTMLDTGIAISRTTHIVSTIDDDFLGFILSVLVSVTWGGVGLYFWLWGVRPADKENSENEDK